MKRLERLTAFLSYLQSKRFTAIVELQDKFQVSERTVFRDIRALEEAGVPISFEKNKGYFIVNGHFLPPMSFTIDEAKSFIFVEQLAKKYTDRATYEHFETALEKIKNKLKDEQLGAMEHLQSKVRAYINENNLPRYLQIAEQACSNQQVLNIQYSDSNGQETRRVVEPIGITFYAQAWHLIAYCRKRDDYRDFSISRIRALEFSEERIDRKHLSLTEYIKKIEGPNRLT